MTVKLYQGDCREVLGRLESESVHCVVTSPPYWGLRDYGTDGQLGLEATPEEHVERMVEVFREVRRVMRGDASLWLNYGDSYAGGSGSGGKGNSGLEGGKTTQEQHAHHGHAFKVPTGLKPKDLVGMPWRVAFALQADGWYLRSDIIWAKPNPMPESVTDRPTKSHEHVFMLSKSARYYYDADAVREDSIDPESFAGYNRTVASDSLEESDDKGYDGHRTRMGIKRLKRSGLAYPKRNLRDVWTIPTAPFPGAHFATFPPKLVEPCIKAGTSEHGCCAKCGAPWAREREDDTGGAKGKAWLDHANDAERGGFKTASSNGYRRGATVGWRPGCDCAAAVVPCTVLDPFGGAGTVGLVADRLGRDAVLIELSAEYAVMAEKRIRGDCPLFADVEVK